MAERQVNKEESREGNRASSALAIRRNRPLFGILMVAVIVAIALPLINTFIIYPAYTSILINIIEDNAKRLTVHSIPPSIKHSNLSYEVLDSPRFFADIYRLENGFGVMKIRIFSPDGNILYSTDGTDLNSQNEKLHVREITATGEPLSYLKRVSIDKADKSIEIDVIETYVPLMSGERFLGAFELYFDVTQHIDLLKRFNSYATYGVFLTGFCILFIVIILLRMEAQNMRTREEAAELKEQVDRITRHDLKTPLMGALSGIQYLEKYTEVDSDQREMLSEMRESMNSGLTMINRSLDIYKMETGQYIYEPVRVDILALCRRVMGELADLCVVKQARFALLLDGRACAPDASVYVLGEEMLCYSLLANLIKNAVEAAEPGEAICIAVNTGAEVRIVIHNSAPVPKGIRCSFFEKNVTANKRTGTGLGTYSAKLMVEGMNGRITMKTSDEEGTTLTVVLPGLNDNTNQET